MSQAECKECGRKTEHRHMHDSPYGLAEAHMSGTERYECQECGHAIYAHEGKKQGLRYFLD